MVTHHYKLTTTCTQVRNKVIFSSKQHLRGHTPSLPEASMRRRADAAGEIIGVKELHNLSTLLCHFLNCSCLSTFPGPIQQSRIWSRLYLYFYNRNKYRWNLEVHFNNHLQVAFHFILSRLLRFQPRNTTRTIF